jgi:hypothetical protein
MDTGVDAPSESSTGLTGPGDASDAGPVVDASDGGSTIDASDGGSFVDATDGGPIGDASDGGSLDGSTANLIPCEMDAAADAQCPGPSPVACCSGFCANLALDPRNCGQCGVACTAQQFCTGVQCDNAVLSNVCGNPSGTVIFDPYAADNEAGSQIGAALAADCVPPTVITQVYPDGGAVNSTGLPSTGVGNTSITGGGGYGQPGIEGLDTKSLSPVYLYTPDGMEYEIVQRSNGTKIVDTTFAALTPQHDYFFVEMVVEPVSGTLSLAGIGMLAPGTLAAGYYMSNIIIPSPATYTNAWYVYQWDDTNGDLVADVGDTFTQLATGN